MNCARGNWRKSILKRSLSNFPRGLIARKIEESGKELQDGSSKAPSAPVLAPAVAVHPFHILEQRGFEKIWCCAAESCPDFDSSCIRGSCDKSSIKSQPVRTYPRSQPNLIPCNQSYTWFLPLSQFLQEESRPSESYLCKDILKVTFPAQSMTIASVDQILNLFSKQVDFKERRCWFWLAEEEKDKVLSSFWTLVQ